MERKAIESPLACYGLELNLEDSKCRACPHRPGCQRYMGSRANEVPLSQLIFKLVPELPGAHKLRDPEGASLQELYETCHITIFGRSPEDRLDRRPNALEKLEVSAADANCSLRMFILATMVGHQAGSPDRQFYANMLLGEAAVKRVERYRSVCYEKFGTFDLSALDLLTGNKRYEKSLEARMLNSEIIAGVWIVGHRTRTSGPYGERLYAINELAFDPHWLAIEQTYSEIVLKPHLVTPSGNAEQLRHRFNVSQTLGFLKRHKAKARIVFEMREKIAPAAVRRVLSHYGFAEHEFMSNERAVTDMLKFWGRVAIALKNYWLTRYLDGDPAALTRLRPSA